MFKSYFFIPANRLDFINKRNDINADFLIFDFEESIPENQRENTLDKFPEIDITPNIYARTYLPRNNARQIDLNYTSSLISLGFTKFFLPKIRTLADINTISDYVSGLKADFEFILLVENPLCLLNLNDILKADLLNITGIALGSHDYVSSLGMTHSLKNLFFARQYILNAAIAYGVEPIDIVSMDIAAGKDFEEECMDGLSMGFDAKMFLHPTQIDKLHSMSFYTDKEIEEAEKLYSQIKELETGNFSVIKLEDRLFERPHLMRVKKIVEWNRKYGQK